MKKTPPQNQRQLAFLLIMAAGVLLILAALAIGFQREPAEPPATQQADSGLPYPEVARIPLDEAHALWEAGTAVILDVRSQENYEADHISGALSMPESEIQLRYQELPRDREILTYCT